MKAALAVREPPTIPGSKAKLWTVKTTLDVETIVFAASGIAATLTLALAALAFIGRQPLGIPEGRAIDLLAATFLVGLGPPGFYMAWRDGKAKAAEARFPDFLRDLAASRKSGLTLPRAVAAASRGDYGALNPEIRRMHSQLEWGIPFNEALHQFAERVPTPLIHRSVAVITEASHLGGNVGEVILGAARDAREIKSLEGERKVTMVLYTMIIYIAFLVFLGVVVTLYSSLIPALVASGEASAAQGGSGGLVTGGVDLGDYRTFYFMAALVQGVGNGMVAGIIGTGKAKSGLQHAFVMAGISLLAFGFI